MPFDAELSIPHIAGAMAAYVVRDGTVLCCSHRLALSIPHGVAERKTVKEEDGKACGFARFRVEDVCAVDARAHVLPSVSGDKESRCHRRYRSFDKPTKDADGEEAFLLVVDEPAGNENRDGDRAFSRVSQVKPAPFRRFRLA